jgi:hypothetical protein
MPPQQYSNSRSYALDRTATGIDPNLFTNESMMLLLNCADVGTERDCDCFGFVQFPCGVYLDYTPYAAAGEVVAGSRRCVLSGRAQSLLRVALRQSAAGAIIPVGLQLLRNGNVRVWVPQANTKYLCNNYWSLSYLTMLYELHQSRSVK